MTAFLIAIILLMSLEILGMITTPGPFSAPDRAAGVVAKGALVIWALVLLIMQFI